jgi:hypothetical protein
MDYVKPETVEAIKRDEFARKTIEATRAFIYAHFRDWERIHPQGKLLFTDDDAATGYIALCALLGIDPADVPDIGDTKVHVGGGQMMSAKALEELSNVFVGAANSNPRPAIDGGERK